MSSALTALQDVLVDELTAGAGFAYVPFLAEHAQDLESEVARALGALSGKSGKAGLVGIVMTPTATQSNRNLRGAYFDPISIVIHFEEAVAINMGASGTQIHAVEAAELAVGLLTNRIFAPFVRPIVPAASTISAVAPALGDRAYAARFTCAGGDAVTLAQVATPAADPAAGDLPLAVELTCATPGAAIFYSVDGVTFPSPNAGTLYTAALDVQTACTLRAKAWLAGLKASEELKVSYT